MFVGSYNTPPQKNRPGRAGKVGTEMAFRTKDRAPHWVRFMLNQKGKTFADIDRAEGFRAGIACLACRRPSAAAETAIATALGLDPREIWPSRFDPRTGRRLSPQPMQNYRDRQRLRTSQKAKAA
jgi:Ner family transcriptional regulator